MLAVVNGAALGRLAVIPAYLLHIHAQNQKDVLVTANHKAWWLCKNGHYFHKKVDARTGRKKQNCPHCPHCPGCGKNRRYYPPDIKKIMNELKL